MVLRSLVLGFAVAFLTVASARATMGAKTIFDRLDTNHDGTVSRSEVIAAAERKYDLIASRNGGRVTLLNLGGRLSNDGIQEVTRADESKGKKADASSVTRGQYVEQTEKAFDKAKIGKPHDDRSKDDGLTLGELSAPSAGDLIGLLE